METAITTITGAMPDVFELVTTVLTQVLSNPILVIPLAVGFIGTGVGVYRMLRKAV
ncbi:MAG: hypothetical protein IJ371_00325 [Clostridia bacterium]|nr:hypothetical protein [Clostridia bacterium]